MCSLYYMYVGTCSTSGDMNAAKQMAQSTIIAKRCVCKFQAIQPVPPLFTMADLCAGKQLLPFCVLKPSLRITLPGNPEVCWTHAAQTNDPLASKQCCSRNDQRHCASGTY